MAHLDIFISTETMCTSLQIMCILYTAYIILMQALLSYGSGLQGVQLTIDE